MDHIAKMNLLAKTATGFAIISSVFSGITGTVLAADAGQNAAKDKEYVLEEIIVSARHKEEVLTEVPASITAYTADFLQKQNIQSFADYATKIPNLTFQYGQGSDFSSTGFSGGRQTTIRGVAGTNTTAYYLNDTPVPSSVSPQTLGLDRIEVLKGPQGTLFGASSMGGNLRFITRKPSLDQNKYTVQAQAGHTNDAGADYGVDALAGLVLVPDVMALDVSFGYTHESGFITRRFPDPSGNLVSKDDQGRNNAYSGSLTLRIQATDQLELTLSALGQSSELMGYPAAYVPLPNYKPVSYTLDRDRDVQEYSKDRWGLGSFALNYNGTGFAIVSSTSFFSRRVRELEDSTEGTNTALGPIPGDPAFPGLSIVTDQRFTHESRISFEEGTLVPHLSGIAGVFYQRDNNSFSQPPMYIPELVAPGYINSFRAPYHEKNAALFGELYYEIVPKLTATLGLRQYRIDQTSDAYLYTGTLNNGLDGVPSPERKNSQSGHVPKFVLSYKVGDNGNVYGSVSKGFRTGGNQGLLPDLCKEELAQLGLTREGVQQYRPDTLRSYEVGAKNTFADGRLTLSSAAFQLDWSNIQQSVLLGGDCNFSFVTNAGKAQIRGGELEASGQPFENVPLTLQFGLGYTHGVLQDPGITRQPANSRLAQVPEWTGTISGFYETPITASLNLFVAADYSYTDVVKVVQADGSFLGRQPFNIVNGNVGVRFGKSEVLLYGKNLLDKRLNYGDLYAAGFERTEDDGSRRPRAAVSRPRQLGVQYRVNF